MDNTSPPLWNRPSQPCLHWPGTPACFQQQLQALRGLEVAISIAERAEGLQGLGALWIGSYWQQA